MLRRLTKSVAAALTTIPFVPATSTELSPPPMPSIVIDLVMVTPPNPPGSSVSISPPGAVFEIAPANVLHGAVRLHGLASSPTPDTHVREAWAPARPAHNRTTVRTFIIRIVVLPFQILIWHTLAAERGILHCLEGCCLCCCD